MNNYNAKSLCKNKIANGNTGHLVEPQTTTMNKLIFNEAKNIFGWNYWYWIGVNDIDNEGNWVYTSTGLPATTTDFHPAQPTANGDCVFVCYREGKWCDEYCSSNNWGVICEF